MTIVSTYIAVEKLKAGMVLGENIHDETGNILLAKGIELRKAYINKIESLGLIQVLITEVSKGSVDLKEVDSTPDEDWVDRDMIVAETREDAKAIIKDCMDNILDKSLAQVDKIILIVNQIIDEILSSEDITFNLANLKSVDDYTFEHSVNVCVLSVITGIGIGLNKVKLVELGIGAILHDIGKMLIPQEILNKPGLLTDEEFEVVKNHTVYGYEVLNKIKDISIESAKVALNHHERFDGNGYPEKRGSNDIHIYSRIVAIADVFDALTSDRVYSKKISPFKAVEYIVSMVGAHFDRELVKKFIKLVGYYYRGQLLQLNTGELALVVKRHQSNPVVRVVMDAKGNRITDYYEIDLSKNPSVLIHSIQYPESNESQQKANGNVS